MSDNLSTPADPQQEIAALKESYRLLKEENEKLRASVNLFAEIEKWSNIYDFSFQFWGPDHNNVFIEKDGHRITDFGGEATITDILKRTLDWIKEKNPAGYNPPDKPIYRCQGCGARIAYGNDLCGECLCEDDGDFY